MIYHDRSIAEPLPARGSIFAIEAVVMTVGASVGVLVEDRVPIWLGACAALALCGLGFPRAARLGALDGARLWRRTLVVLLALGIVPAAYGWIPGGVVAAIAALAVGEVGAVAATDAPWPRGLSGWRPVFRLSTRLFGVIAAAALVDASDFAGIAAGSLAAVVLALLGLPLWLRPPRELLFEGRRVPAVRRRCPRCGVPSDWPSEGPGHCPACGLICRNSS